jgi:hypothetical protein
MPAVIILSAVLMIAALSILAWRWLEIRGQIQIERAKATKPIWTVIEDMDKRVGEIEKYMTGEDYKTAVDWAVSTMPPALREKWKEGQRRDT